VFPCLPAMLRAILQARVRDLQNSHLDSVLR
jgi:hypothetical protein